MVSISQVQRGFACFVDNEIATAFDGWQKAIIGGVAGLFAANLPNVIKVYGSQPFVAALGVYDANSGNINIDALYNAIVPKLGAEKIPIQIPKIGAIKLGREEFDALVRYIKEA